MCFLALLSRVPVTYHFGLDNTSNTFSFPFFIFREASNSSPSNNPFPNNNSPNSNSRNNNHFPNATVLEAKVG